ncbi:DUF2905 domain-containing protein [Peribacillus asahii]|jgi:ribose/xylose/arabinose/galactoside ABC-type transport system permease subunit|uniref:DUF2905 domain-containing protein n=1 Tax=Peribacillus asahii TaxID=228899 RepID=A0A398B8V5_9BACI|nr:DUF2905 domain-containing protein [Peribacillus asahii]AZV44549.1 membrane protein [Peribacillus asahii]RID85268.1 DUF2905 domain-containing protein [Peribacillus asahii]USK58937.1 DUF2905 domain-containing protein [Peribacillus asahii]USK69348.1 DUF2905 domain-containing protein [Peribacillus asahii]USK84224.1 DUF2905 domain-containing protein [Peribacillus asahii]
MTGLPKILMTLGVILFIIGFAMKFINLGKLPGDIVIKKENTTFYFPIVTSIIVSLILSAIFYVIGRFK